MEFDQALQHTVQPEVPQIFTDIILGDCRDELKNIKAESVHLVVTDPPYFLDGLDSNWRKGRRETPIGTGSVGGLPVGMKFDPRQGTKLQRFITEVGESMKSALVPGAFAVFFSQPRLVHRLASGLEDAGFEIRDLYAWRYTQRAQFKAFSMDHFVDRMEISPTEKVQLKRQMQGRKTPQLRPQFEAMVLAQKPRCGTFIENWLTYQTGLIDPNASLDGRVPSTVMTVEKPVRENGNRHLTVKPVLLIEHLIKLFSIPGQVILDPFLGSGTTAVAAKNTGRACIGIEINPEDVDYSNRRLKEKKQ
jgi:DNA modification methylase